MMIFTYSKFYYNSNIMNIIDCFMYYDEEMVLDIRLNILDKYVSHFVICEANFNHNGTKRELQFNIENYKKFKEKIIYLPLNSLPENLKLLNKDDTKVIKNSKNFRYKKKVTIFEQKMYYYKLNLLHQNFKWYGSKLVKKKHLLSPQWLRNIKSKKYPLWRMDIFFSNTKYNNIKFIKNGGWHFTNVKSPEKIDFKMRNFLHHLEYEESGIDAEQVAKTIKEKKIFYDHGVDKRDRKWGSAAKLVREDDCYLPKYIIENKNKFKNWLEDY